MDITIIPFEPNSGKSLISEPDNDKIGKQSRGANHRLHDILYWGIYLDGRQVSYTSSKELAEKTKIWMEKWLSERN